MVNKYLFAISCFFSCMMSSYSQTNTVLLFVSHEDTYYSEYIVMLEAFEAQGYTVDVRSASNDSACTYMIPASTTIANTANSLSNSSYSDFQSQFSNLFDSSWNATLNSTPN